MNQEQIAQRFRLGSLLAISGGFMDAYSYMGRGQVFANAQTGNILLAGIHLSQGAWQTTLRYAVPVVAFFLGILLAELIQHCWSSREKQKPTRLYWRQVVLLVEIFWLTLVAFLPQSVNLLANSLISLTCGLQVEAFRKVHGTAVATTMCIGNLRGGTEQLFHYVTHKDTDSLHLAQLYFGLILFFVLGAVVGNGAVALFQELALLFCPAVLAVACWLLRRKDCPTHP